MLTLNKIKEIQEKYELQVHAKKRFGQNFLIDENVLKHIIEVADIKGKEVIEVGPGMGSLTVFVIPEAKKLTAYEIDRDMVKVLNGEIKEKNFELIEGDFLKQELDWEDQKTLVANLPYYITSDILFKLFENVDKFDRAIIMIQNEVADRLSAPVGSKQYGKLTISTNYFATVKKEFVVKPSSFSPAPKVNSAIVSLTFNKKQELDNKEFLVFVKKSFTQRRKTLFNNWKLIMSPEKARELIMFLELPEAIRPQNLTVEHYKKAFTEYKKYVEQPVK
ncbi:16S rRNA (adenine(1518)-N(6)/adenine(1519)-N(6))-dimethyltransferase RsmA [Mycoplasma marinum]|uniref:Ribosomal RNA small subunit methyltransferase A n=1 Tax=Mycoplasma marinum TaxID=1937190 RepID=A0A4R0XSX7_9MOLU|nr:16S rRNA (adenine(1518)-N(6)/adenine(1519)-N(6))-dimethyltransferase RsmA [Mycoplasma marinum]TCG11550.1 16S rRNA (adenine(1518)-N(6)/adenine(1519)-N(6))-dimethyltransferase [Mycoplasma marinum]